jgi:hypothetical protein
MTVNDYVRIPVTDEVLAGQLETLSKAFPNSDEFYKLLAEMLIPLKLTEGELKSAIKEIILHHSGKLYIADVVIECEYQRLLGIRREKNAEIEKSIQQWRAEQEAEQKAGTPQIPLNS